MLGNRQLRVLHHDHEPACFFFVIHLFCVCNTFILLISVWCACVQLFLSFRLCNLKLVRYWNFQSSVFVWAITICRSFQGIICISTVTGRAKAGCDGVNFHRHIFRTPASKQSLHHSEQQKVSARQWCWKRPKWMKNFLQCNNLCSSSTWFLSLQKLAPYLLTGTVAIFAAETRSLVSRCILRRFPGLTHQSLLFAIVQYNTFKFQIRSKNYYKSRSGGYQLLQCRHRVPLSRAFFMILTDTDCNIFIALVRKMAKEISMNFASFPDRLAVVRFSFDSKYQDRFSAVHVHFQQSLVKVLHVFILRSCTCVRPNQLCASLATSFSLSFSSTTHTCTSIQSSWQSTASTQMHVAESHDLTKKSRARIWQNSWKMKGRPWRDRRRGITVGGGSPLIHWNKIGYYFNTTDFIICESSLPNICESEFKRFHILPVWPNPIILQSCWQNTSPRRRKLVWIATSVPRYSANSGYNLDLDTPNILNWRTLQVHVSCFRSTYAAIRPLGSKKEKPA